MNKEDNRETSSLWDRMWEEYRESVSARRKRRVERKEKRIAKKQEKLRKFYGKHVRFAGIFAGVFLPILLFTVVLCIIGTVIAYLNMERVAEEKYSGMFAGLQEEFFADYDRLSDTEDPVSYDEDWILETKWDVCMQTAVMDIWDSYTAAVYDVSDKPHALSDMPKVFDCSEMFEIGVGFDGENHRGTIYMSDREPFAEVMEEYERLERKYPEQGFAIELEDCYIKGKKFLPGQVFIVDGDGERVSRETGMAIDNGENAIGFDLTPENAEGYTHIYNESNRIFGPVWAGSASMNEYDRWFAKLQEKEIVRFDCLDADGGSTCLKDGTDACMMFFAKYSSEDESIPDLLLISFWEYNIVEMYGKRACGIYAGILALAVALSLILAYRSYFRYQAQSQMNRYRREMTNAMAHDLKSPLMVISGYAENLRDNVHMEKKDYYAEAILENVQYMNKIIHNILQLSKIESGKAKLQKTEVELKRLTEAELHKYEGCIEDKGLEISVDLADAGCILADEDQMAQVVDNLLSNAVKYTPEQGEIFVKAGAGYYEVRNSMEETLGMDAAQLWKPFVKGDNSRGNEQGSGIGLTIVKNIVEQHGFRLELLEEDGIFVAKLYF
ncbi:MAG: HAMP domain-containing histidine kinase [Clostridium sp.]|nr:HAMP domain-containing histidine kinase [Clostridium sp.]